MYQSRYTTHQQLVHLLDGLLNSGEEVAVVLPGGQGKGKHIHVPDEYFITLNNCFKSCPQDMACCRGELETLSTAHLQKASNSCSFEKFLGDTPGSMNANKESSAWSITIIVIAIGL